MDSTDALSRSRSRERRLSEYSTTKTEDAEALAR